MIFISRDFNEAELRRLDLNLLLVFAAVMRTGSVKGAADRLYLGPSAVSMALGRLRKTLGTELFIRNRGGVEPTETAIKFYRRIAPALEGISGALHARDDFDPAAAQQIFRLGISDDLESIVLPKLLTLIRSHSPGTDVVIRSADIRSVVALLNAGTVEVALCPRPVQLDSAHQLEALYQEDFIVVADPALGLSDPLSLPEYLNLPHALVSASGRSWGVMDDRLAVANTSRRVAVTVERFSSLPFLLSAGRVIATLPRKPGKEMARIFNLDVRELPVSSPTFSVTLIHRRRFDEDPAQRWFRRLVRHAATDGSPTKEAT